MGRPKGVKNKLTMKNQASIVELARKYTDVAMKALVDIAGDSAVSPSARVAAASALIDRGYGKPSQDITHKGDQEAPLNFGVVFVGTPEPAPEPYTYDSDGEGESLQ